MRCGLLGKKLGHSYSPAIHAMLSGSYTYGLFEKEEAELPAFLRSGDWDGLNVTIPYKKTVIPYLDGLSETARAIGSVNTIVRREDGSLYGDNTDYDGFLETLRYMCIEPAGQKVLVLGSGGASAMACYALKGLGAEPVVISRSGENNYGNLHLHADAELLVNTTPVGMFPDNGKSPISLELFPELSCVVDFVYNPMRTKLILEAEELDIPHVNGLRMLVGQARRAAEIFTGKSIPLSETGRIMGILERNMQNAVLIGMPGCGKSTLARLLGKALGREVLETDAMIEERTGRSIPDIIRQDGEDAFRRLETEALAEAGKQSGKVISTGGGCITRAENYELLYQNGVIIWIERALPLLAREGRPLSEGADLAEMYRRRAPFYDMFADFRIENNGTPEETLSEILEVL